MAEGTQTRRKGIRSQAERESDEAMEAYSAKVANAVEAGYKPSDWGYDENMVKVGPSKAELEKKARDQAAFDARYPVAAQRRKEREEAASATPEEISKTSSEKRRSPGRGELVRVGAVFDPDKPPGGVIDGKPAGLAIREVRLRVIDNAVAAGQSREEAEANNPPTRSERAYSNWEKMKGDYASGVATKTAAEEKAAKDAAEAEAKAKAAAEGKATVAPPKPGDRPDSSPTTPTTPFGETLDDDLGSDDVPGGGKTRAAIRAGMIIGASARRGQQVAEATSKAVGLADEAAKGAAAAEEAFSKSTARANRLEKALVKLKGAGGLSPRLDADIARVSGEAADIQRKIEAAKGAYRYPPPKGYLKNIRSLEAQLKTNLDKAARLQYGAEKVASSASAGGKVGSRVLESRADLALKADEAAKAGASAQELAGKADALKKSRAGGLARKAGDVVRKVPGGRLLLPGAKIAAKAAVPVGIALDVIEGARLIGDDEFRARRVKEFDEAAEAGVLRSVGESVLNPVSAIGTSAIRLNELSKSRAGARSSARALDAALAAADKVNAARAAYLADNGMTMDDWRKLPTKERVAINRRIRAEALAR